MVNNGDTKCTVKRKVFFAKIHQSEVKTSFIKFFITKSLNSQDIQGGPPGNASIDISER